MAEKILITGGSGFVGQALIKLLVSQGYQLMVFSRKEKQNTQEVRYYNWNVEKGLVDEVPILEADYIIHLAGENISQSKWTKKRKKQIIDSRVLSTELLYAVLAKKSHNLKAFISASAIGIYGTETTHEIFSEESITGADFLASVCESWENSVDRIGQLGIRTVKLRTGVVLGKEGGALQKMLLPIEMGIGSALGSGSQIMSWIHIEDLCLMYLLAMNNEKMNGAYNAVVGDALTNKELSQSIANRLNKPFIMPNVPAFLLKIIFGEMASILLYGSQVSSNKIQKAGFIFKYNSIENTLDDLLKKPTIIED
jgi:uncharacterized protein (TIGR01777 family)